MARKKRPAAARKATNRLTDSNPVGLWLARVPDQTRADILEHAREGMEKNPPEEICGFIGAKGKKQRVFRSPNKSSEPQHHIRTCTRAWRKVEDSGWEIVAIYHSHVNEPPTPSIGDKVESEAKRLPFIIVGMPTGAWDCYIPNGWEVGLEGRPYVFGTLDCRTLQRDYYKRELGIVVPDFHYEDNWWENGQDLLRKNYRKAGFVEVNTLQKHDTLLMAVPPSQVMNHCAVYLGDGQILHHLMGRLSVREPYLDGHGYARMVGANGMIVRHRSLC